MGAAWPAWKPQTEEKTMTNPFRLNDNVMVTDPEGVEDALTYGQCGDVVGVEPSRIRVSIDHGAEWWDFSRFTRVTNTDRPPPGKNPKARRGATKSPLGLIPPPAEVAVAEVFGLGAAKYGAYNWRETRVEAMTYVHAMKRHLASWLDGENQDPESGQSHLAHIAANAMILLDAYAIGMIDDNRPPAGVAADLIRALTKKVN
jgi:hypothetical protein